LDHVGSEFKDAAGNPAPVKFDDMTDDQQKTAREEAEERYISYVFLRQSGTPHNKLKVDLQNDFTTGDDHYPKNRQATLHVLDKYSKSIIVSPTTSSEGTSFAQKGGGKETKPIIPMTRTIGKTRNAIIVIRLDIRKIIVQILVISKMTMPNQYQAKQVKPVTQVDPLLKDPSTNFNGN
jgi:hypothetical protein